MKKVIDSLLDTLLVIGAIACILTVGGGKWMAQGYDSQNAGLVAPIPGQDNSVSGSTIRNGRDSAGSSQAAPENMAAPVNTTVENPDGNSVPSDYPCPAIPLTGEADWMQKYQVPSRYYEYMQEQDETGNRATVCR